VTVVDRPCAGQRDVLAGVAGLGLDQDDAILHARLDGVFAVVRGWPCGERCAVVGLLVSSAEVRCEASTSRSVARVAGFSWLGG
jgi:hypothetical protein